LLLHDGRRRQRGSVLSGLLIIVAFLAILIGGLLTELTSSFVLSRDQMTRVKTEATVTSAVELGIHQLEGGPVPAVCAQDARGPWYLTLNGHDAAVTQTCSGIVPEVATGLAAGSFTVDGIHDTAGGNNRYLVANTSGRLNSYPFGQTQPSWSIPVGGRPTAPPLAQRDPNSAVDVSLLVPVAEPGGTCSGHCVALYTDPGSTPSFVCDMPASVSVTAQPAAEVTAGGSGHFPGYAFFGDAAGDLYVYNSTEDGGCNLLAINSLGGGVVGAPLVFPGTVTKTGNSTTISDEVFVLVSRATSTQLFHLRYSETTDPQDNVTPGLGLAEAPRAIAIGGNAVGYAISSTLPVVGSTMSLAVATASGRLGMARIAVGSGPVYSMSSGASIVLPNGSGATRAAYWCHCPTQDLIGVGGTNGFLYLFNNALSLAYTYDGQPDGRPAIQTTPMADANGDWYFGASDGFVYDVEIPVSGLQLFKAAKFGPGGAIASSPIVGACVAGPCMYFGSSSLGSYFVRIGTTRVSDLRACISSTFGSTICGANPRLWARVQVGPAAIWGNLGVYVQGWSYYSP
jgi:hypothetical protein